MSTCKVVCIFRRPLFYTDSLISLRAGPLVHVELMPVQDENSISYTSYVGYPFCMSLSAKHSYNDETCVAIAVDFSEAEMQNLNSYLHDLCEANIPYNYMDTALMILPTAVHNQITDDLPSEAAKDIHSLFCAQAVILSLSNSLTVDRRLYQTLLRLNSRTTTPYTLFHVLREFGQTVCCNALQRGAVVPLAMKEPV
eukprot:787371-Rhodomonas_salina.3